MDQRHIEIFVAGCPLCETAVATVQRLACEDCTITVQDLKEEAASRRAAELGVRSLPAVAVDGRLASCCDGRGIDEAALREAGIGQRR